MELLHSFSILLEAVVMAVGLLIALQKKKKYGWGIAFTFAVYVFYDTARFLSANMSQDIMYAAFFAATLSILWAVYAIYKGAG
jgi:predicted membrane protein